MLTKNDVKLRLRIARKVRWKLRKDFETGGVGFYLDRASFTHEMNPFDQARAPRAIVWRKRRQRLNFDFDQNGSHQRPRGSVAQFMAAIAYGKGVIAAEQYFGRINTFVHENFASMFKKSSKPREKLFVEDGDPS